MTPSERRRRFIANVRRQARRRKVVVDEGALRVGATLAELQQRIRQMLAGQPSDFDASRLPEMAREVERLEAQWRARAIRELEEGIDAGWELGPQIVTEPLAAAEVNIGIRLMPRSLLEELKEQAIKGLNDLGPVAKDRIFNTIRLSVLGGESPHEAMKAIGDSVTKPGPFKMINFRAETIYRTEVGRVHSMAAHRRQLEAAEVVPGLGKEWIWSGKGRMAHSAVHGQKRAVDEPFLVAGEELMYPRDPNGSAENTINCGCESVPWKDDWK